MPNWGTIGSIGGIVLALYLIMAGVTMIVGSIAIPVWFIGLTAIASGVLVLLGK